MIIPLALIRNPINSFFMISNLNPLYSLILIPIIGYFFFKYFLKQNNNTGLNSVESFRFSIQSYSDQSVQIVLSISDQLSGKQISNILMKALPVIGRQDPDILRLLLFHCLETLENDEQLKESLNKFRSSLD